VYVCRDAVCTEEHRKITLNRDGFRTQNERMGSMFDYFASEEKGNEYANVDYKSFDDINDGNGVMWSKMAAGYFKC
jgi:hypothetical protein